MNLPARIVSFGKPLGLWLQACAVLAIALGMGLAFAAAGIRLGQRFHGGEQAGWVALGIAAYLLLAASALAAIRWIYRRRTPVRTAATVIAAYLLVQLGLVFAGGAQLLWQGDAALLHQYVQTLAEQGYAAETLSPLSEAYDYQVWSRRAIPFYFLIQRAAGAAFPMAIQSFNALVMALSALLTWRLATLLFGSRVAVCALALHVLMPWRLFTHLDLSHHILGGFYYSAGIWLLVEWHQPRCTFLARAGLTFVALLLLPLMHLEGGIDFVFAAAAAGTLLLAWLMGKSSLGQTAAAVGALLVLPLLSAKGLVGPLDARLDAADRHHYDTGILAWSTRGWSVDTGGQYYGNYEQVDILTPRELKKKTMLQIIASQAYYNPAAVAFRQLPTKAAKFFMAGYASGFEEMLQYNRMRIPHALHVGARAAYLLGLLPLAIGGGFVFLVWLRRRDGLFFLVPCTVLAGAYVVCGESDPRYSAYLHSYYFLAAGAFIVWLRDAPGRKFQSRNILASTLVPSIGLILLSALWSAGIFALRPWLIPLTFWDMRQATVHGNEPLPVSATLAPFEIRLPPVADASTWGEVRIPLAADENAEFSFYLLPLAGLSASHGTPAILRRQTAQGWIEEPIRLPARIALHLERGDARSMEILAATLPPPFPLMLGYANLVTTP